MPHSYGSAWYLVGVFGLGPSRLPAVMNRPPTSPPRQMKTMAGRYVRSTRSPVVSPTCNLLPQSGAPHLRGPSCLISRDRRCAHPRRPGGRLERPGRDRVRPAVVAGRAAPAAWPLIRAGQACAIAQAIGAGVLAASGLDPDDGLYWLYALLPVAVGFVAEQLRLASAQQVLDVRDLEDAQAVGRLPADRAALDRAPDRPARDGRDGRGGARHVLPGAARAGHGRRRLPAVRILSSRAKPPRKNSNGSCTPSGASPALRCVTRPMPIV